MGVKLNRKRTLVLVGIIAVIILVAVGLFLVMHRSKTEMPTTTSPNSQTTPTVWSTPIVDQGAIQASAINLEQASAKVIKATLALYYVTTSNNYPVTVEQLVEQVLANPNDYYEDTSPQYVNYALDINTTLNNLKDFEYSRRGDGQAYRFTYTSTNGDTITETANYQQDFQ